MKLKTLSLAILAGMFILACSKGSTDYPWLTEVDPSLHTSDKLVGYEFFAKW